MSIDDRRVSRRGLLGLLRPERQGVPPEVAPPASAPGAPAFSLDGYYRARDAAPKAGEPLPSFSLREGLAPVPTSRIGVTTLPQDASASADGPVHAFEGVARVRPYACLAHQGSFCSVCVERCPVPGAIEVELGRPRVVEEACTGCGACIHACPAPVNGFDVVSRPVPSSERAHGE